MRRRDTRRATRDAHGVAGAVINCCICSCVELMVYISTPLRQYSNFALENRCVAGVFRQEILLERFIYASPLASLSRVPE